MADSKSKVEPVGFRKRNRDTGSFSGHISRYHFADLHDPMWGEGWEPIYTAEQIAAAVEELRAVELDGRPETRMSVTDALCALLARFATEEAP